MHKTRCNEKVGCALGSVRVARGSVLTRRGQDRGPTHLEAPRGDLEQGAVSAAVSCRSRHVGGRQSSGKPGKSAGGIPLVAVGQDGLGLTVSTLHGRRQEGRQRGGAPDEAFGDELGARLAAGLQGLIWPKH